MTEEDIARRAEEMAQVNEELDGLDFEGLVSKTRASSQSVRKTAAARLMNLEDPRAVPVLMGLLDDQSAGVRGMAALGLRHYEDGNARDTLIDHLRNDESADVRGMCAMALGSIGGSDEEIIRALDDPDPHVKIPATISLNTLGKSSAADRIAVLLDDECWDVRYYASLALIDFSAVTPQVVAALESLRDIPEALDSLRTFAEADIFWKVIETFPENECESDDDDSEDPLDSLRRKYGAEQVPFPPENPLGDLISKAKNMLAGGSSQDT
jgi:HEAT repeat protein